MKHTLSTWGRRSRIVVVVALGFVLLGVSLGWQFAAPARSDHLFIQRQIDALPRANGTGMHASPEGGVIRLAGSGNSTQQRVYRIDKPLRLWSCVALDGGGAKIVYTGPPDRAAIELASYRREDGYFGPQGSPTISNLHIVSGGKGIAFDPALRGNAHYITIENVTISAAGDAIDLRPPDGWCHNVKLETINVYAPGAAALWLHANVANIDAFRVRSGPRESILTNPPPAFINLRGITGGGGIVRDVHVEAYNTERKESITQIRVEDGSWTIIQGHLEQPGPNPAVLVRGAQTVLSYINPGWYMGQGIRVEDGAKVSIESAYDGFFDSMFQRDARSTITLNGQKRGALVTPKD